MEKDLLQLDLKRHEIVRSRHYLREDYSPFSMIGVLRNMTNRDKETMDILDILEQLPKGAFSLFNQLKLNRDPATNMCCYPINHLTRSEQVAIRRNLGELYKAGIVKKAKTTDLVNPLPKHSYMINPYMIKCFEYSRAKKVWLLLTEGKLEEEL